MTVLEAHVVTKAYREGGADVPVLRGVSLAIRPGEVVALRSEEHTSELQSPC